MDQTGVAADRTVVGRDHVGEHLHAERLAEMVVALCGCPPSVAVNAVLRSTPEHMPSAEESLEIVARAVVSVRRGIDLRDRRSGS